MTSTTPAVRPRSRELILALVALWGLSLHMLIDLAWNTGVLAGVDQPDWTYTAIDFASSMTLVIAVCAALALTFLLKTAPEETK